MHIVREILLHHRPSIGYGPIHWAAVSGHIECVEELLKAGADHAALTNEHTLETALGHGEVELLDLLLRNGQLVSTSGAT